MPASLITQTQVNVQPPLFTPPPGQKQLSLRRVVLQNYRDCALSTRTFLRLRWRLTPYEDIAALVPAEGMILDLGCGHGLLTLTLALQSHRREIHGIDHDQRRLRIASNAARGLVNVRFTAGDFTTALQGQTRPPSAIIVMDALHYLNFQQQENLIRQAQTVLRSDGLLIVREVDTGAGLASWFNKLHERLMTWCGFTRADQLYFRTADQWEDLFSAHGFTVHSEPCSHFPFSDHLFVCRKG